jgi:hypothetical protein
MFLLAQWRKKQIISLNAYYFDRPTIVQAREARKVMEVYLAADLSAERGEPISMPMNMDPLADKGE